MMKKLLYTLFAVVLVFGFVSCKGGPSGPKPTVEQAGAALEDVFLVSGTSMFMLFQVEDPEAKSVSSEDESITLSWEDLDQETGAGKFTIKMDGYSVDPESMFADEFNGYTMTGTIEMDSTNPEEPAMTGDVDMSHEDSEQYPVTKIEFSVQAVPGMAEEEIPEGSVKVNGHEFTIKELSEAMQ